MLLAFRIADERPLLHFLSSCLRAFVLKLN